MILSVQTRSETEFVDITARVEEQIKKTGISEGFCMLYVPHTTAGITINESADPAVKADILMILNQIIPRDARYRHMEGNSAAHIKSSLIGASQLVPIENGTLSLGTWQGLFFCEFDGPRTRKVQLRIWEGTFSK